MNKSRFPSNSYIGSLELRTVSDFIENDFHKILSGLVSPGLIIRKLSGGLLDTPFKVYVTGGKSGEADLVKVTPGLFISSSGGVARIFELKNPDIHIDTMSNGSWNVCVVANISGYEEGRVSFTNNSDAVTISGGTFAHLRPFASIIAYEENSTKPFGAFKVIEVSGNQAKLSVPFPGENKLNMKWKAGARFPDTTEPNSDDAKVMFEYNTCEAKLSNTNEGTVLGTVNISEQGGVKRAAVTSDRRGESLAVFNNNAANADDVRTGAANSITTIEEKAQAARVYNIVSDYFTPGVRSGGLLSINSSNVLTITQFIAYDGLGARLESNSAKTFNLPQLAAQLIIKEGKNPLYAWYAGPGAVNFSWSAQDIARPGVLVGIVTYIKGTEFDNNITPDTFTASSSDIPRNSVKAGSLISTGRKTPATTPLENTLWTEGEIYYNSPDKTYYFVRERADHTLEADKLICKKYLDEQISAIKYLERLRFTLYPFAARNNWFLFNGIAAPAPVGYGFVIVQWKIGVLDTSVLVSDENSVIDYMGGLGSPKIASEPCNWTNVLTKTKKSTGENLSAISYQANSAIGVYFHGKGSGTGFKKAIELKVGTTLVDNVDMESDALVQDSGYGSPINKLYSVEVTIQLTSGIRYAVPQEEQTQE
jgi:hypothetical protein